MTTTITLPVSKEEIKIEPVSPLLMSKLRGNIERPKPPTQLVNYGTSEKPDFREEVNEASPEHQNDLDDWVMKVEAQTRGLVIDLGTDVEWTDDKKRKLERVKSACARRGIDLSGESDVFIYVSYVAILSSEDYNFLLKQILGASRPTEEAIQEGIASFRAELAGNGSDLQREKHI